MPLFCFLNAKFNQLFVLKQVTEEPTWLSIDRALILDFIMVLEHSDNCITGRSMGYL